LYFFWHQNVDRFLESASHQRPIVYYLLNFPLDALPWTPFVALALFWSVKRLRQADRQVMLPIIWFVLGFIFFSLASSKRSVYLLPLYPAVAALVGIFWAHPSGLGQFIQTHMPAKAQAQRSMKKLALLRFMVIFSGKT
jgi:4-amino-4-deoxy-L-arabinose transferase-like glycosyltransferase